MSVIIYDMGDEVRELRAEVARLTALFDEERKESAAWRATARDKGESARKQAEEVARLTEERDRLGEELADAMHPEFGSYWDEKRRAETAEAEVTRLRAQLATVAEFIEHDDCGYCGLRLSDKRAGCTECEPVKLALGFRAPLVTEGE